MINLVLGFSVSSAALVPLVDPTRPPSAKILAEQQSEIEFEKTDTVSEDVKGFPDMQVNAIRVGKKSTFAIINGEMVKLGGTVESATLKAVYSDYVEFDFEGKTVTLSLVPPIKSKALKLSRKKQ